MTSREATPLGLFAPQGAGAHAISPLLWGLIWLSVAVIAVIAVAVVAGLAIRASGSRDPRTVTVERSGHGLSWIYVGVGLSTATLLIFVGWTVSTIAAIAEPPHPAVLTIAVSARQWWWSFAYDQPNGAVVTANELHIPVATPVRFVLTSPDVIHSFWIPALGGKTDVIPGRTNEMWLEAERPGTYRGQCSEFCGAEHAEMGLLVYAEPQAEFDAWLAAQAKPAAAPDSDTTSKGAAEFVARCGRCHTVRGTDARGTAGPDLTHLMTRTTLAAGMLDNTIGNLSGWIADPQAIKPDAKMPDIDLSGPELQAIVAYLKTLT
jgi:cytochrome c oxidase subunit 2